MTREISDEMVEHVRDFLGPGGRAFFRRVKAMKGAVAAVIPLATARRFHKGGLPPNGKKAPRTRPRRCSYAERTPHPTHFREGMEVRNALRESGLCEGWNDHDYDDQWSHIVDRAMRNEAFDRGWLAAYQDACENCHFASAGGMDHRDELIAPDYIPEDDRVDYLLGYESYARETWGPTWRTDRFTWGDAPVLTIGDDDESDLP